MAKSVVRVHFMDSNSKAFAIDAGASADAMLKLVIERLELKESATFALFEKKDDWERCLEPDEKPAELMKAWTGDPKDESSPRFLFKKKTFIRDDDRELSDLVARHLVYIQALASVVNADYPTSPEQAVRLAGLQVQVVYGDHNAATHVPGFLTYAPFTHPFSFSLSQFCHLAHFLGKDAAVRLFQFALSGIARFFFLVLICWGGEQ
jgi:hypothetical protein